MLAYDGVEFWRCTAPDRPAIVMGDRIVDYAALGRWTDRIALNLSELGVGAGDVVAVTGVNSIEWIAAALGALKVGATVSPYNVRFVESELRHLIAFTEPKVLFSCSVCHDIFRRIAPDRPLIALERLEALLHGPETSWTPVRVDSDAPAFIILTSGTSGSPKGVITTHANILLGYFERKLMEGAYRPGMRRLSVLGLHGAPGVVWGFLSALTNGGTFYLHPRFDAARALETIVRERITVFSGVPLLFEQIAQLPQFEAADLSSLESVHVGGAPVSRQMLEAWRAKGVLLRQIYGMSEASGLATVSTDDEVLSHAPTCGAGGVFTRIRVIDEHGEDCAPGVIGQALIRGPTCTPGYWKDPEGTRKLLIDGWVHTGDRGVLDDQGRFQYVDRQKDLIISGGYNISPAEIENLIVAAKPFAEVAAIPVPDDKFGETPGLCIYLAGGVDVSEIVAVCTANLADYKVPRYVFASVDPLPRLASGKIDKINLKARYSDASARFEKVR